VSGGAPGRGDADAPATAATEDAFLGGALSILQPAGGYRAGLDAVLLAASLSAQGPVRVLDIGAGVGVVGLAAARRLPDIDVTLLERDPGLAALARQNIARNALEARARIVVADIARPLQELPELAPLPLSFDHALVNPPYNLEGHGTPAAEPRKAAANAMPAAALERWMRFAAAMLRPGGTLTLIHRPEALQGLLAALARRFGGLSLLPIHPRPREPASRLLVHAVKGSRAPLQLQPGLVLHGAGHGFRPQIEAILRHGAALDMGNPPAEP
jgi:tRNA1(Val) A37 N6-methylase TrmN6